MQYILMWGSVMGIVIANCAEMNSFIADPREITYDDYCKIYGKNCISMGIITHECADKFLCAAGMCRGKGINPLAHVIFGATYNGKFRIFRMRAGDLMATYERARKVARLKTAGTWF